MKIKNTAAFTFVEMIVVITIIAILATIGFTVYQSYLDTSRDTNRVVQLSEIEDGLNLLTVNSRLPLPEEMISIEVGSGTGSKTFAFQGFAGPLVMQAIGYTAGGEDPEYGIYPSYMLSENRRNFQLLSYVQDAKLLSQSFSQVSADTMDFQKLFPKVAGDPLGILIEKETQIPLQLIPSIQTATIYNITTGTGNLQAYFTDTNIANSSQSGALLGLLPNQNCKRILELGKSQGNGIYTINPTGTGAFSVYCDMTTDSGGWTLVARSVLGASAGGGFGWLVTRGSLGDNTQPYSLGIQVQSIDFSDILFTGYYTNKIPAGISWKLNNVDKNIVLSGASGAITHVDCSMVTSTLSGSTTTCDASDPNWKSWGQIRDTAKYYISWNTTTKLGLGLFHDRFQIENSATNSPYLPGMVFIR